jgi:FkbM family methyltransferase
MFSNYHYKIGNETRPNVLVSCDQGLLLVNRFDNDCAVGRFILDHGNNNTLEADFTIRSLGEKEDPIIFDVGSNIGTYAYWLAKRYSEGKIYCFEPQRIIFQMLCGNMAMNNIFNVHAFNMALSDVNEMIECYEVDYNRPGCFSVYSLNEQVEKKYEVSKKKNYIQCMTIDSFVEMFHIEKVDFIKVDAEGFDIKVLNGAKKTLNRFEPDLFVEYLNLGSSGDYKTRNEGQISLEKKFKELNYTTYVVGHDIYATKKNVAFLQQLT